MSFYNTIVPWAMLCYVRKSITIEPTSIKKQLSNQCSNFDRNSHIHPNLALFWEGLGSQVGAKMVPNRSKNQSKHRSTKMITFWIVSRSIFDRFWAPTWGVQGGPLGVRRATFWALEALLEPRWSQEPPKIPQDPSKRPLGNDFWRFWDPTWWFLE